MKEVDGNVWDFHPEHFVVVPTNIGWTRAGVNVMGAGVAKQALYRYPEIARLYGGFCQEHGTVAGVVAYPEFRLIMFPVKPLDQDHPDQSWRGKATRYLVEDSAEELSKLPDIDKSVLPLVGCGNGGLDMRTVLPILREYLDDRFTLINYRPKGVIFR